MKYYYKMHTNSGSFDLGRFNSFKSALVWAKHRLSITGKTHRVSGYCTHNSEAFTYATAQGQITIEQINN